MTRQRIDLTDREVTLLLNRIVRAEYPHLPPIRAALPSRVNPRAGGRIARLARRIRRSRFAANLRRLANQPYAIPLITAAGFVLGVLLDLYVGDPGVNPTNPTGDPR